MRSTSVFPAVVRRGPSLSASGNITFDDGVTRPTKKGINLKKKEWEALVSVTELVDEAVNNLKSEFTYEGKTIVKSVCVYFADKKCYQYGIVGTGEVFCSPTEEPVQEYKKLSKTWHLTLC